jgi:hypothetical protein|tara:strand:+ start:1881 stop:2063 length:183 start_codon:yes stop_codon:yes gene_type:complete
MDHEGPRFFRNAVSFGSGLQWQFGHGDTSHFGCSGHQRGTNCRDMHAMLADPACIFEWHS